MKSYLEIKDTCLLMVCIEAGTEFVEVWEDSHFMYTCTWLQQNIHKLPSTIKRELLKHDN